MGKSTFRVLLVDDYDPWRRFVSTTLQKKPELQVVGEASDGLEAVQKAQALQPDLILLDIGLPTVNGIEGARRILRSAPKTRILFVSEQRSSDIVEGALRTGAGGYVLKSDATTELLPAVEAVLQGNQFVSFGLSRRVSGHTDIGASEVGNRIENNPYLLLRHNASIRAFLASIIEATAADFGNVQLFDSKNRVVRIVAQQGFESEFLDYFDSVSCDHKCACSNAMSDQSRTIVIDVATDPLFSNDSRGVLLRAKVRSVQSTPLIAPLGKFVGIVSTHYKRSAGPKPHMWKPIDDLAGSFVRKLTA